jgi:DNA-binding response OmpR family regulator
VTGVLSWGYTWGMRRPCILVIDHEFPGTISTRKLVIETAKFNVITAYSSKEGLETLARFPNVDGVVLNAGNHDLPCVDVVAAILQRHPAVPIITTSDSGDDDCSGAHHTVRAFDPAALLEKLRSLFPTEDSEIKNVEKRLAKNK